MPSIKIQDSDGVRAGDLTGRSAAGKYGFLIPCPGFYGMRFEERNRQKWNLLQTADMAGNDTEIIDEITVHRIVFYLKMKELHRNIDEVPIVH